MIIIRTCKIHKETGQPHYKEYYCTTGVKAGMNQLNYDRQHNDLLVYSPTEIVDVWDNNEGDSLKTKRVAVGTGTKRGPLYLGDTTENSAVAGMTVEEYETELARINPQLTIEFMPHDEFLRRNSDVR
jgi:hypothetical protein